MRTLMLGAGATGGYFGGRLAESGADITFLVRPRRAAQLAARGLVIKSALGDSTIRVKTVMAGEKAAPFDLAILSCKAYDLASAVEEVAPLLAAKGVVLPLLNGLHHIESLSQWLGASRVLGGLCYIGAALDSHGDVRHIGATPGITFGEISGERSARAKAILEVLGRTTIAAVLSDNIIQAMWEKLVMLASMAVVTTLTRAVIGEIMAARTGESFARAALAECEAVAAAEGHPSTAPAIERTRLMLMTRGSPLTSSMMRDLVAGGRTEGDHVIGDMVRRAQARGMETPLLTAALCNLDIHEAKRVGASS